MHIYRSSNIRLKYKFHLMEINNEVTYFFLMALPMSITYTINKKIKFLSVPN